MDLPGWGIKLFRAERENKSKEAFQLKRVETLRDCTPFQNRAGRRLKVYIAHSLKNVRRRTTAI